MARIDPIETWIAAARQGDPLAVGKLLAAYHPLLKARVEARLHPPLREKCDPEDILQLAYMQVVRQFEQFRSPSADAFVSWALTIVDRQVIDAWRAVHRQQRDVEREIAPLSPDAACSYWSLLESVYTDSVTPSRIVRKDEALDALLKCVSTLSDAHRQVIQMRFLEGLTVEEVATRLHSSRSAIVAQTRRALDALRESMDRLGEFTHGG